LRFTDRKGLFSFGAVFSFTPRCKILQLVHAA
jgi:hypothetical protein